MNPHRPGWQTSEFWIALASQLLALLMIAGWINPADKQTLEQNVAAAITAIFTIVGSVAVVVRYIDARCSLKHAHLDINAVEDTRPPGPLLPLIVAVACGFAFAGPAAAQTPAGRTYVLPWRQRMYNDLQELKRRQQPQSDPALAQALAQIAATQQQLLHLLHQQSAPPQHPIILLAPPYPSIPLGGQPRQDIPPGGPPRQEIPLGGPPKQPIPLGPPPQNIPLGPAAPALPGVAKPGPLQPQRYVPALAR